MRLPKPPKVKQETGAVIRGKPTNWLPLWTLSGPPLCFALMLAGDAPSYRALVVLWATVALLLLLSRRVVLRSPESPEKQELLRGGVLLVAASACLLLSTLAWHFQEYMGQLAFGLTHAGLAAGYVAWTMAFGWGHGGPAALTLSSPARK